MLVAHLATIAVAVILTTWGASLVLRALACKAATLRNKVPFSWMFRGASVWDPRVNEIGTARVGVTVVIGVAAFLAGGGAFAVRLHLQDEMEVAQADAVIAVLTGWLWSGALAAVGLGLFADRAAGRLRCPTCWYDMRGQRGLLCPECGRTAKHERALQRTRRSKGMIVLAGALLAMSVLPGAVRGYLANGWLGTMPTWALIVFANDVPAAWVTPSVNNERYGPLEDRWKRMNPFERWLMLEKLRRHVAKDYRRLFLTRRLPASTNLDSLMTSEPIFTARALASSAAKRDVERRRRVLLAMPTDELSDDHVQEIGFLTMQAMSWSPASVQGDDAPILKLDVVRRLVKLDYSRGGSGSYISGAAMSSKMEDARAACDIVLQAFDDPTIDSWHGEVLGSMLAYLLAQSPAAISQVEQYLERADATQQLRLMRHSRATLAMRGLSEGLVERLRESPDARIRVEMVLYATANEGRAVKCRELTRLYNETVSHESDLWWSLRLQGCRLDDVVPGMIRDLRGSNDDLIASILIELQAYPVCDVRLRDPLIELLQIGKLPADAGAFELLLRVDPTLDVTTLGDVVTGRVSP